MFWVQILPLPLPPTVFFVHCTIPSILGSHLPYPTPPPIPNIHKKITSPFTSTLIPRIFPNPSTDFIFEFSQKLQFFVHIDPTPPPPSPGFFFFHKNFNYSFTSTLTPQAEPPPDFFFRIFTKTSILRSHPP